MPNKPPIPCRYSGCPNLTNDSSGYCPQHKKEIQHIQDDRRSNSATRGYDNRWRKARQIFLAEHPLCALCLKENRLNPAEVVDHIVSPQGDYNLFWGSNNWQALCKYHHNQKTAREDGGYGNKRVDNK